MKTGDSDKPSLPRTGRIREWYRLGWALPWLVLATGLVLTYLLWQNERKNALQDLQVDFSFRVREVDARIDQRMKAYEQILRGVRSFLQSSRGLTSNGFRTYVDSLNLGDNYPGSQSIGFIRTSPAGHGTVGKHDTGSSIVYLDPLSYKGRFKHGSDISDDSVLRLAMERARDTGLAFNSGKVLLPQSPDEDPRIQSGFVMFLPVYRNGPAPATMDERRSDLVGWVYASFRMVDLMINILGNISSEIDIEIHDGEIVSDDSMIYDPDLSGVGGNPRAQFRSTSRISVANHEWTVVMRSLYDFERRLDRSKANFVAYVGIQTSLLLAILASLLVRGRAKAVLAQEQLSNELAQRRAAEARLQHLAHHDALTDLPNRVLFSDRVQRSLAQARRDKSRLALMFLDLDNFKLINDNFGHDIGDMLLKEVAKRLMHSVRETDTVSRIGGDEFVILLPVIEAEHDAEKVAEKMLHALNQPFKLAGQSLNISGSIGIAVYPEHGKDERALAHRADVAMYYAKSGGRNNARIFHQDMLGVPDKSGVA